MGEQEQLDFGKSLEVLDGVELDLVDGLGVAILTIRSVRFHPEQQPSESHYLEPIGLTVSGLRMLQKQLTGLLAHMEKLGLPQNGQLPQPKAN